MKKLLSILIYLIVRLLRASYRYKRVGLENKQKAIDISSSKSYIISMWHQSVLPGMLGEWGNHHNILLSQSKDGDLLGYASKKMGYFPVRGSSTRGGTAAKKALVEAVKRGENAAMTPDGPVGPAKVVKDGIIDIARSSGGAILPIRVLSETYHAFNSWDKFQFPLPFSRIIFYYGDPILVPKETEREGYKKYKEELAQQMNKFDDRFEEDMKQWKNL